MSGQVARVVLTGFVVVLLGVASVLIWVADETASPTAEAETGAVLFATKGCIGCHNAPNATATMSLGPDLRALPEVAAERRPGLTSEDYVRESILAPEVFLVPGFEFAAMPTIPLGESELDMLVAYLLEG